MQSHGNFQRMMLHLLAHGVLSFYLQSQSDLSLIESLLAQAAELAAKDAEDPLDAFMAQEILPEVKQKEQQEAARKEEERKELAQQLAVRPLLPAPMSSDSELSGCACLAAGSMATACCHNVLLVQDRWRCYVLAQQLLAMRLSNPTQAMPPVPKEAGVMICLMPPMAACSLRLACSHCSAASLGVPCAHQPCASHFVMRLVVEPEVDLSVQQATHVEHLSNRPVTWACACRRARSCQS